MNYQPKEIKDIIKNEKNMFLVGAGVSIDPPSNGFTALQICKFIIENLIKDDFIKTRIYTYLTYDEEKPYLRFEELIGILSFTFDNNLEFGQLFNRLREPNFNHFCLANILSCNNCITTTNFDVLIELAANRMGKSFKHLVFENDFKEAEENGLNIVKLHGSVGLEENKYSDYVDSMIITVNKLGKIGVGMENDIEKKSFFVKMLKKRNKIVVGYSGGDNTDIIPLLINEFGKHTKLIWFQHSNKNSFVEIKNHDKIPNKTVRNIFKRIKEVHNTGGKNLIYLEGRTDLFLKEISSFNSNQLIRWDSNLSFDILEFIQNWKKRNYTIKDEWLYLSMQIAEKMNDYKLANRCWHIANEQSKISPFTYSSLGYVFVNLMIKNINIPSHTIDKILAKCTIIDKIELDKNFNLKNLLRYYMNLESLLTIYIEHGKFSEYNEIYNETLDVYRKYSFKEGLIRLLLKNSQLNLNLNKLSNIKTDVIEAIKIAEEISDFKSLAQAYQRYGIFYYEKGANSVGKESEKNYSKSIENLEKSITYFNLIYDFKGKAEVFMELYHPHMRRKNFNKAIKYLEKAIYINKEIIGNLEGYARCLKIKANFYYNRKEFKKALNSASLSLKYVQKIGNENSLCRSYQMMYLINYEIKNFKMVDKYLDLSDAKAKSTNDLRTFYDNLRNRLFFSLQLNKTNSINIFKKYLKFLLSYPNHIHQKSLMEIDYLYSHFSNKIDQSFNEKYEYVLLVENGNSNFVNLVKLSCESCDSKFNTQIKPSELKNQQGTYFIKCLKCNEPYLLVLDEKLNTYFLANLFVKNVKNPFINS